MCVFFVFICVSLKPNDHKPNSVASCFFYKIWFKYMTWFLEKNFINFNFTGFCLIEIFFLSFSLIEYLRPIFLATLTEQLQQQIYC